MIHANARTPHESVYHPSVVCRLPHIWIATDPPPRRPLRTHCFPFPAGSPSQDTCRMLRLEIPVRAVKNRRHHILHCCCAHEWGLTSGAIYQENGHRSTVLEEIKPTKPITRTRVTSKCQPRSYKMYCYYTVFYNKFVTDVAAHLHSGLQQQECRNSCLCSCFVPLDTGCRRAHLSTRVPRQPRRGLDCGLIRAVPTHQN